MTCATIAVPSDCPSFRASVQQAEPSAPANSWDDWEYPLQTQEQRKRLNMHTHVKKSSALPSNKSCCLRRGVRQHTGKPSQLKNECGYKCETNITKNHHQCPLPWSCHMLPMVAHKLIEIPQHPPRTTITPLQLAKIETSKSCQTPTVTHGHA